MSAHSCNDCWTNSPTAAGSGPPSRRRDRHIPVEESEPLIVAFGLGERVEVRNEGGGRRIPGQNVHVPPQDDGRALVGGLSVKDPDFRSWWAAHEVAHKTWGTKALNHPVVGALTQRSLDRRTGSPTSANADRGRDPGLSSRHS